MRRTISMLVTIMLLVLCACQPTPENEAVINKGDGVYEQKLETAKETEQQSRTPKAEKTEASSAPAPTEVPVYEFEPHWTDTVSLRNFDVTIDVDVEAPITACFPVYRVKAGQFTVNDELVRAICQVLMGDVVAVRPGGATIQDLKESLKLLQKGEYDSETQTWHPYDKKTYDDLAGSIMKDMETAPDESDFTPVFDVQVGELPASMTYKAQDGVLWALSCYDNIVSVSRNIRCTEQPERWVVAGEAIPEEPKGTILLNVSCTEEEARQYTKVFFEALNIGDMDISRIEKGRAVDLDTLEITKEGWLVECARKGGSCSAVNYQYNTASGSLRYNDNAYSPGLNPESILLFVDDMGVASFSWSSPLEVLQNEVDNIEIMSWERAKDIMKQAVYNGLSWTGNKETGSSFGTGLHVTKVILSYCFIPVKDTPNEFFFTPTWFVFLRKNSSPESIRDYAIAINAVDGTRIDLSSVS